VKPGVIFTRSRGCLTPRVSSFSPVAAVIDIGTLLADSCRFSAVTTISWTVGGWAAASAALAKVGARLPIRAVSDAPAANLFAITAVFGIPCSSRPLRLSGRLRQLFDA
jgi:hypothetical protein